MKQSLLLLALITAASLAGDKEPAKFTKDYHPKIDPANFIHVIDNPYFPLKPGTVFTYSEKEGKENRDNKVEVTHETKIIMGVKCVVVRDTLSLDGKVLEDTFDWYAQDKEGAVWYFGEDTKEYKSGGRVSTEGSWEAGVKGGQPGIVMPAHPKPGEPYRQEYGPGAAEDVGQVIAVNESTTVPAGTYKDCVRTKEWSLLESGHEKKWYAKGTGLVRAESGDEVLTLLLVKQK